MLCLKPARNANLLLCKFRFLAAFASFRHAAEALRNSIRLALSPLVTFLRPATASK